MQILKTLWSFIIWVTKLLEQTLGLLNTRLEHSSSDFTFEKLRLPNDYILEMLYFILYWEATMGVTMGDNSVKIHLNLTYSK